MPFTMKLDYEIMPSLLYVNIDKPLIWMICITTDSYCCLQDVYKFDISITR